MYSISQQPLSPKTAPQKRSLGRVLWKITRPHTLTASVIPVFVGTALARRYGRTHLLLFLAMLTACLLIQIATNLFNEYYDFKRGLDTQASIGIGGAIVREGFRPRTVMAMALAAYVLSILAGVYICANSSWWLALIGLVGMLIGYLYTGGPLPIAYTPLGEIFSGVLMGGMFILISFFIQTGYVNKEALLLSLPTTILVGAINMANNIRDRAGDKASGRRTLAILLGHNRAVCGLGLMFAAAYLWIAALALRDVVSPWLLLVFLSIPKAAQAVFRLVGKHLPWEMMPAVKATAQTNTLFGLLLSLSLLLAR
ncbi:1,4-dihydroxy-2-naphthoate polyprenyltransferase [Acididesulfobacillus acetoxydans]|uniref:1,4-dihydroxy-2-naphthoate octaprenyltransferase n=1 Tax=Acididesulfobacillus acetoxydans TaxID=1561005 RepID=A0A8S0W7E9_9FIRM|nr:1,4-dihydroxy-2-naphthoate polyprenyltransferase [Acididesulfobacillus acetoxydans]CAA7600679.1 1,4-dihydroxy-2-naphthoate polyprenyltransferase [Acididesulfobacillus acetoxydans]CEJ09460.1 1,4-dihydroxy-2-naphthoate octaprenyltransferase [Acididesulfobacillus acetoxydans]